MHSVKYIRMLKLYLRHVSVKLYHLQGEQYDRFKTNLPMRGNYLQDFTLCSRLVCLCQLYINVKFVQKPKHVVTN